jgi:hypothetical protein
VEAIVSSEMPWVKIYTEILDDPKIGPLSDRCKWRFIEVCLLAGECDSNGYLVSGDRALALVDIAWRIRKSLDEIKPDYEQLITIGVIKLDESGAYFIPNFEKRQGRPQHEKRDMWLERQNRHRGIVTRDTRVTGSSVTRDSSVSHASRGEERRIDKEEEGEESATLPPHNSHLFSSTDKGSMVYGMLKDQYHSTTDRFENDIQRDAYLAVFETLNGELEGLVKKGLAKGIRTKGDMLTWLQGCAKHIKPQSKSKDKPRKTYQ